MERRGVTQRVIRRHHQGGLLAFGRLGRIKDDIRRLPDHGTVEIDPPPDIVLEGCGGGASGASRNVASPAHVRDVIFRSLVNAVIKRQHREMVWKTCPSGVFTLGV